jgi:hypothetical protein
MAKETPDQGLVDQDIGPAPPAEAAGGEHVELHHKPHPVHSWREFLKEYGIIVLGVLTALGGEQLVELAHRGMEVREARDAIRAEMRADASIIAWGVEEDKCLDGQLSAYAAWARGGPKPAAFRSSLPLFRTSTWDTVKTGAVPHMPLKERLAIAGFYDDLSNEQNVIETQRSNGLVLFGAHERGALDAADAGRILEAVAVERQMANFHDGNAVSLLEEAAKLGVKPAPLTSTARGFLDVICGRRPVPEPPVR